jgi:hypothetical protein
MAADSAQLQLAYAIAQLSLATARNRSVPNVIAVTQVSPVFSGFEYLLYRKSPHRTCNGMYFVGPVVQRARPSGLVPHG